MLLVISVTRKMKMEPPIYHVVHRFVGLEPGMKETLQLEWFRIITCISYMGVVSIFNSRLGDVKDYSVFFLFPWFVFFLGSVCTAMFQICSSFMETCNVFMDTIDRDYRRQLSEITRLALSREHTEIQISRPITANLDILGLIQEEGWCEYTKDKQTVYRYIKV